MSHFTSLCPFGLKGGGVGGGSLPQPQNIHVSLNGPLNVSERCVSPGDLKGGYSLVTPASPAAQNRNKLDSGGWADILNTFLKEF